MNWPANNIRIIRWRWGVDISDDVVDRAWTSGEAKEHKNSLTNLLPVFVEDLGKSGKGELEGSYEGLVSNTIFDELIFLDFDSL